MPIKCSWFVSTGMCVYTHLGPPTSRSPHDCAVHTAALFQGMYNSAEGSSMSW